MRKTLLLVIFCAVSTASILLYHFATARQADGTCIKDGDPAIYDGFPESYREASPGDTVNYSLTSANCGLVSSCPAADTFCCHVTDTRGYTFVSDPPLGEPFVLDPGDVKDWYLSIAVPYEAGIGESDTVIIMMAYCDVDGVCAPECGDCEDPNWYGGDNRHFTDTLVLHVVENQGTEILPGQGMSFYQVDFAFEGAEQGNSAHGLVIVNRDSLSAASGLSSGYVNVRSDRGWIIRNLAVYACDCCTTTSTTFDLGTTEDVNTLTAHAEISEEPLTSFSGAPDQEFTVATWKYNAQGIDSTRTEPPADPDDLSSVVFWHEMPDYHVTQKNVPNVEQDVNQCAPASIANSLQYLENRYEEIQITDEHVPGIGDDGNPGIAAKIDKKTGRSKGKTISPLDLIRGKLEYISENDDLYKKLDVHHKAGSGYTIDDKITGGKAASTADDAGWNPPQTLFDWIEGKKRKGADVELVMFGTDYDSLGNPITVGHAVTVTEIGYIKGQPYIKYSDDFQGPLDNNYQNNNFQTFINGEGGLVNVPGFAGGPPKMALAVSEGPQVKNKEKKVPKKPKEEGGAGGNEEPKRMFMTAADTVLLADYDFEAMDPQGWYGVDLSGYGEGDYTGLYNGIVEHDPLNDNLGTVVTFFSGSPYPSSDYPGLFDVTYGWSECGQPARLLQNEWRSPIIPLTGTGSGFILQMSMYLDNPLDDLVFATWHICSYNAATGLAGPWRDLDYLYYSESPTWVIFREEVGAFIEPGATHVRLAVGAWDMADEWSGTLGTGYAHTPAPFFDNVKLYRIGTSGPEWSVRDIDLFHDAFVENGSSSGTCRTDANGDTAAVSVGDAEHGLGTDPSYGGGAVYIHVKSTGGQSGGEISGSLARWPYVSMSDGWTKIRMDTVDACTPEKFCVDLNDSLFVNGDTVFFYFSAVNGAGAASYWSQNIGKTSSEAAVRAYPDEMVCLPTGNSDMLYVNAFGSRGASRYFETAFEMLGETPDRFDWRGPTSRVNNNFGNEAVKEQIIGQYTDIIYNSGDLEAIPPDDIELMADFLALSETDVGLYLSGDGIAAAIKESSSGMLGYISYDVIHKSFYEYTGGMLAGIITPITWEEWYWGGEPGPKDTFYVDGGEPVINNFDVLEATGAAIAVLKYPEMYGDSYDAAVAQATVNEMGDTARVVLSGFSFHLIRDVELSDPPSRVKHLYNILTWFDAGVVVPTEVEDGPPLVTRLYQNYPNPFNATTTIKFSLHKKTHVSLKVYNVAGQLIRTIVDEELPAGIYSNIGWNGTNSRDKRVGSGIYFYRFAAGGYEQTRKMILLR